MNQKTNELLNSDAGFIKLIILIVIGLIVLGYFGFNIKDILASPIVKQNLDYAWELTQTIWNNWLQGPFMWLFENVIRFLWDLFLQGLQGLGEMGSN